MADPETGDIGWYEADPRGVIPIDRAACAAGAGFRVPRSVRVKVRRGVFAITCDQAFGAVIRACAGPRGGDDGGSWIDERIVWAFEQLHAAGHAHSVEAWVQPAESGLDERVLVGGLYGVHVGGLFAGESMFSKPELGGTDASKVCLVHLVEHLQRIGVTLLDTQMVTPVIELMGGVEIGREAYLERLAGAIGLDVDWGLFAADRMDS